MFKDYFFLCSEINKGKSIIRAFLNLRLSKECLRGKTIDIGGGGGQNYLSFMERSNDVQFQTFDLKVGKNIDFEKDTLPSADGVYDTVLFLNVMEHIFNYQHIANEVVRITKSDGQLIGFVPFLMWYHPDHRDFFRYTDEAIKIIFTCANARDINIEPIGKGPFIASIQMVILLFPRFFRLFIFSIAFIFDELYLFIKKGEIKRYVLGYFFIT
jgi:SAM-dependent methyltransferase